MNAPSSDPAPLSFLDRLRREELSAVATHFSGQGLDVLELGGGNGCQAQVLSEAGHLVKSLDVDIPRAALVQYFPVRIYDGHNIPFEDGSFDRVYSSNVLEHVDGLPALMMEMSRVLRPEGRMVHVVPTATWRVWTWLAYYPFAVLFVFGFKKNREVPRVGEVWRQRSWRAVVRGMFFPTPHGHSPNVWVECFVFRTKRWTRLFDSLGYDIVDAHPAGYFYTGYTMFPGISMGARKILARVLGSSSHVFVLKPRPRTP